MRRTVRFHTGSRVVRLSYDPEDDAVQPFIGSPSAPRERTILRDVLVIAAGGFTAMWAFRSMRRRGLVEPESSEE
ncbi:MAG TPA: hypothetical protein VMY40_14990 [Anaerolineae bacterium]|nr:hypothetical protein [Anaerolineae bacterium]